MMELLLDLANIVGGFLLAIALFREIPQIGTRLARGSDAVAPFAWIVGVIALVAGGYFLIIHVISGPHVFHFEIVGIGVGLALLWDRLTGRTIPRAGRRADRGGGPAGPALLLSIFGIIAIIVGIQGLLTPN